MIQASRVPSPRAERAAVRKLADRVDAARLAVGRRIEADNGSLDQAAGGILLQLWSRRFAGALGPEDVEAALRELGVDGSARVLRPVTSLLSEPCSARLAARLAQAHELTLLSRVERRGRRVVLETSSDRRAQGAYYTPPDVVEFLVEETLGALLRPWEDALPKASRRRCLTLLRQAQELKLLDPACGGGAFLLGALTRLRQFYARLAGRFEILGKGTPEVLAAPGRLALAETLRGVDIDGHALALAELALLAAVSDEPDHGASRRLIGTSLRRGDHLDFGWQREAFAPVFARRNPGFDVLIGNPPYAPLLPAQLSRLREAGFKSLDAKDIYVFFVEAIEHNTRRQGHAGFIVPLSLVFSRWAKTLREGVILGSKRNWRLASFDRIPSGLFDATVRTRTTLVFASGRSDPPKVSTTCLRRFRAAQRPEVFNSIAFFDTHGLCRPDLGFPKLGSELQATWLRKLASTGACLGDGVERRGAHRLYYKQNCYGFAIVAAQLPPAFGADEEPVPQTKYGSLGFPTRAERDIALALLAGRWLFWWWLIYGDGFDMTGKLISAFPIDPRSFSKEARSRLSRLGARLRQRMPRFVAYKKNGGKQIGTYDLRQCRSLTDPADDLVARELGAEALLSDLRSFLSGTHGAG